MNSQLVKKVIFGIIFISGFLISCLKEDVSNISGIELESNWLIPIFDFSIGIVDVLSFVEIEDYQVDSDSLLHIIVREDSLITIQADSLLDFDQEQNVQVDFSIGNVNLEDFSSQVNISLLQISSQLDSLSALSLINAANMSSTYFPPININYGGAYPYESFADFNYINM